MIVAGHEKGGMKVQVCFRTLGYVMRQRCTHPLVGVIHRGEVLRTSALGREFGAAGSMMRRASISDPTKRGSWKPEPAQANRAGSSIFHSFASSTCVPTRLRLRSNPFDSRTFVASRITVRLTPYSTHSSDSLGRYSLGWISPDRMRRARVVTISRCMRGLLFRDTLRDCPKIGILLQGSFLD